MTRRAVMAEKMQRLAALPRPARDYMRDDSFQALEVCLLAGRQSPQVMVILTDDN
jgi:hypothetical protein